MISKTPEELMQKIIQTVQTRDPMVVKEFLEDLTNEIIEAQKPAYEQMLISAAEQGIIAERERCLTILQESLPEGDSKVKIMAVIRGDNEHS